MLGSLYHISAKIVILLVADFEKRAPGIHPPQAVEGNLGGGFFAYVAAFFLMPAMTHISVVSLCVGTHARRIHERIVIEGGSPPSPHPSVTCITQLYLCC